MRSSNESSELASHAPTVSAPAMPVDGRALDELLTHAARSSPREVLTAATTGITRLLGERGSCILLDGQPRIVVASDRPKLSDYPIDLEGYPEVRTAAETQKLVAVDEVRSDPQVASVDDTASVETRSRFAVPLVARERCFGVILVQSAESEPVDAVARSTALLLARTAALLVLPHLEHEANLPRIGQKSATPAEESIAAQPSRVLVVEDDVSTASALMDALVQEGYEVDVARDGHQALRCAEKVPDLVLLDVHLPGISGFDTAASLRQSASTRGVPILFLSGTDDLPTRVRDMRLEQVDFMPKPFSLEELLTRIQQALGRGRERRRLQIAAEHDELTGLGNLRLLHRTMAAERARFARYGHPVAVAMIDVDKLKAVNDSHGHVAGNEMLRDIARVLRRQARTTDLVVRYGGDEFVALLPHTGLADARVFGKRVQLEVASLARPDFRTTVSVGIAALTRPGSAETIEDLLRRADRAAYRSKQAGGNRLSVDDNEPA